MMKFSVFLLDAYFMAILDVFLFLKARFHLENCPMVVNWRNLDFKRELQSFVLTWRGCIAPNSWGMSGGMLPRYIFLCLGLVGGILEVLVVSFKRSVLLELKSTTIAVSHLYVCSF